MAELTDQELLAQIVKAWDKFRLSDVSRLIAIARARVGQVVVEPNKDR